MKIVHKVHKRKVQKQKKAKSAHEIRTWG